MCPWGSQSLLASLNSHPLRRLWEVSRAGCVRTDLMLYESRKLMPERGRDLLKPEGVRAELRNAQNVISTSLGPSPVLSLL